MARPGLGSQAGSYVSGSVRKAVLAQVAQLAPDSLPAPADLAPFWIQAEAAVLAIDAGLSLDKLTEEDI